MKRALLCAGLLAPALALAQAPAAEREAVPLDPAEREFVLAEMRDFLAMIEKVSAALARRDFDAVAAATRPLGAGGEKGRMPPQIAKKLPPRFRALARGTHEQLDVIAADAARRDAGHTLEQTSRLLAGCNACHAAYRFAK